MPNFPFLSACTLEWVSVESLHLNGARRSKRKRQGLPLVVPSHRWGDSHQPSFPGLNFSFPVISSPGHIIQLSLSRAFPLFTLHCLSSWPSALPLCEPLYLHIRGAQSSCWTNPHISHSLPSIELWPCAGHCALPQTSSPFILYLCILFACFQHHRKPGLC